MQTHRGHSRHITLTIEEGKTLTKTKSIKIFKGIANMVAQAREPSKINEMIQSTDDNREEVMRGNKGPMNGLLPSRNIGQASFEG